MRLEQLKYPCVHVAEHLNMSLFCLVFIVKNKPEYGEGIGR